MHPLIAVIYYCVSSYINYVYVPDYIKSISQDDLIRYSNHPENPLNDPYVTLLYGMSTIFHIITYFEYDRPGKYTTALTASLVVKSSWPLLIAFLYHFYNPNDDKLTRLMKYHHFITFVLLYMSWIYDYRNYGVIVLFISDFTDISMTLLRYIRKTNGIVFVQFCVWCLTLTAWFYWRIYFYAQLINNSWTFPNSLEKNIQIFVMLLSWSLNVYWTLLLLKKGLVQAFTRQQELSEE